VFAGSIGVARGSVAFITDPSNEGRAYAILGYVLLPSVTSETDSGVAFAGASEVLLVLLLVDLVRELLVPSAQIILTFHS